MAPSFLGATAPLVKGYTRASFARPLAVSLTWAHGYSLAWGPAWTTSPCSGRSAFGGRANSLRGFDEGGAGPLNAVGEPTGGEAVVVINQELRYRHAATGLGIGIFYDVGNVFPTVSEMTLDLRHTLGAGVRYVSPVGLLRLDLGWLVDAREDESSTRWHFTDRPGVLARIIHQLLLRVATKPGEEFGLERFRQRKPQRSGRPTPSSGSASARIISSIPCPARAASRREASGSP